MRLDHFGKQMLLDGFHNILKVRYRYETRTVFIESSECFDRILLVKVVQKLTELAVVDVTSLVLSEIQLDESAIQIEGNPLVKFCFFYHLDELI